MSRSTTILMLLVTLLLFGCDDAFSPFADGISDPPHVMHGVIDSAADTHFVRLEIVRQSVDVPIPTLGEVTLLSSVGSRPPISWTDSLIVLDDGSRAHLFYAAFEPVPDEEITLTAAGPDDRVTAITRRMPRKPVMQPEAPLFSAGRAFQTIKLANITEQPDDLFIDYTVFDPNDGADQTISVSYAFEQGIRTGNDWEFVANLSGDRITVGIALGQSILEPVRLRSVAVRMKELGEEWDTRRDSDIGFLGTIGRYEFPLPIDAATIDSLNFVQ